MTKLTVAHLKRTLTPGTRIRITNHFRPMASRDTHVHDKTNTANLVTWGTERATGRPAASFLTWPKAGQLRGEENPNVFHIDDEGRPFLTIEVIGDDHPDAASWPDTVRHI